MKKKVIYVTVIMVLLCLFLSIFLLKNVMLWEGVYFDCKALSQEENKQIKIVLLDAVKDRCSSLYDMDTDEIYDSDSAQQIIQYDTQAQAPRSWFCLVNLNFMSTVSKTEDGRYQITVKLYYPEACYYCFEIGVIDGKYRITYFQIDI